MIFCALFVWNVLCLLLVSLLGICYVFFNICAVLRSNLLSCSLWDLTRKVLFLVSLATARRVGELKAVSSSLSSSGDDLFLSYLLELRAKTESFSNPLPCSFCVRSLKDFVGALEDELLLCPVRALREYLSCTLSISASSFFLCVPSLSFPFPF